METTIFDVVCAREWPQEALAAARATIAQQEKREAELRRRLDSSGGLQDDQQGDSALEGAYKVLWSCDFRFQNHRFIGLLHCAQPKLARSRRCRTKRCARS
jgi:hypothetical protein